MGRTMHAMRRFTAALGLTVLVVACASDDGASDDDGAATTDALQDEPEADAVADDSADADDGGDDRAAEEAADGDDAEGASVSPLDASDGWSELHSFDLPDPGIAQITIDGELYEAEVACQGAGEVPDELMDGNRRLNEFIIFNFLMSGSGQVDDLPPFRVHVERGIWIDGDRWLNLQHAGYGGDGQFDVVSFSMGNEIGVARLQSPSLDDPEGSLLPVVHVSPDGGVTAEGELTPEFEGDEAPVGPFTLAARCQEGWPEDVLG